MTDRFVVDEGSSPAARKEQKPEKPTKWEHILTRIEDKSFGFLCSAQPKMEFICFGKAPRRCPICREINPLKMETP